MEETKVLTIERLAFGGDGVGRVEGKVVFVPWTAPGDKVRVRITEENSRFDRGEMVELLESSPSRTQPPCTVFGRCGGCQWQHLDYPTQLAAKEAVLRETLERIGGLRDLSILPIIPSKPWAYRQRIQLRRNGHGDVGFLQKESDTVVEFQNCEIADPQLNEAILQIRREQRVTPPAFELILEKGDVVTQPLEDPERLFSQVNPEVNDRLIKVLLDLTFGRADPAFSRRWTVVELYSGSGNFTFPLSEWAGRVVAIEEVPAAVRKAETLARQQGIHHVEFIQGSAEWGLKKVLRSGVAVDSLVLDPPRRGAKEILDMICVMKPRQVIYVSCDPSTLARDLKFLVARHFQLETLQPLDMFPQTYHIESVTKLVRRNGA